MHLEFPDVEVAVTEKKKERDSEKEKVEKALQKERKNVLDVRKMIQRRRKCYFKQSSVENPKRFVLSPYSDRCYLVSLI